MATEIILPRVFREHSFCTPAEQVPSIVVDLPGKIFAVSEYDIASTKTRAEQLYSHVEHGINNGHSPNRQYTTLRWFPGMSADNVANSVPGDKDFVLWSQVAEDRGNAGMVYDWNFVDDVFQKYFARTGQADPANTNIFRDYFDADGLSQGGLRSCMEPIGSSFWTTWRSRFSSESEARKNTDGNLSSFFGRGVYNFANWMGMGYLDGWHRVPEYTWVYHQIAEIEQKHLAVRRKVCQFAWDMFEGAEWKIYAQASFQATRFENPAGFIYKATANNQPPEMMYRQGLISHLIGDGVTFWGPPGRSTSDQSRWVRSYTGGYAPSKTLWKGDQMAFPVNYDYNNPSHPKKSPGDNPNNYTGDNVELIAPIFSGPAPKGIHNALGGRYMAHLTRNAAGKLRWAPFTFKINGGSAVNGYYNGSTPVPGDLGDASLSTLNNRNFGQHNILRQLEYKKPICLETNDTVHYCNPVAKVNETNEVTLGDGTNFTVIGPRWRTFQK